MQDHQKAKRPALVGPAVRKFNTGRCASGLLGLEHLAAAIHASLEVDVMRTAQLARVLVLDIGSGGEGIGGAAEAALHQRGFALWNGHSGLRISSDRRQVGGNRPGSVGIWRGL